MRQSHNLPIPSRIYPPFLQLYLTLPEFILPSQNLPRPPRIYPFPIDMRPSHNLPIPPEYNSSEPLYATLPDSTPPSQNIPPPLL